MMNTLNSLPNCAVSANTTKTLKTRFDKLGTIRIQDIYNFRAYSCKEPKVVAGFRTKNLSKE